jgi:hypothetical protein
LTTATEESPVRSVLERARPALNRIRPLLDRARPALPAVALFYGVQIIGVLMVVWRTSVAGLDPLTQLTRWDGEWFVRIAGGGYDLHIVIDSYGEPGEATLAFFPAYPALMAGLVAITGLAPQIAGLVVTALAGGAAAAGLFFLGRRVAGARTGTVLAALWAMTPGSHVLHMVYSEALFAALAVWALFAVLRRRWLLAGVLTLVAGLTRVTAAALIAAVVVAAVIAIVRRQDGWRPWVAAGIAPLGLAYYLGLIGWYAGRLDGWFWIQKGAWHQSFDAGQFTVRTVYLGLLGNEDVMYTLSALVVIVAVVLLFWSYTDHLPLYFHVYSTSVVILAVGNSGFWSSRARFLLLAFVILIPLARVVARIPNRALAILLPVGAAVVGWYGASLLALELTP